MKIVKSLTAGLLAAGLTFASGIGQAQAQSRAAQAPARAVTVTYADLDLRSQAGQAALSHRLAHAIRDVCGAASSADLAGQNAVADCRRSLAVQVAEQRETALAGRPGTITLAAR